MSDLVAGRAGETAGRLPVGSLAVPTGTALLALTVPGILALDLANGLLGEGRGLPALPITPGELGRTVLLLAAAVTLLRLLYFSQAARRIHEYNPRMKLIAVLRNPIDRAYSAYWFARSRGTEKSPSFEEALAKEAERARRGYTERAELTYLGHGRSFRRIPSSSASSASRWPPRGASSRNARHSGICAACEWT